MVGGCRLWVFGWNADVVCLFIPHKYQQTTKQLNHKITRVSSLKFQFLVQKRHDTSFKVLIIISLQHIMISWISKTFSSVKITPENNAISIDNQQIKLLNPYQKREHRTGHPTK